MMSENEIKPLEWWHSYCAKGEVHFLKGRLKFGKATNSAPFPSAVVVFRPTVTDALNDVEQLNSGAL